MVVRACHPIVTHLAASAARSIFARWASRAEEPIGSSYSAELLTQDVGGAGRPGRVGEELRAPAATCSPIWYKIAYWSSAVARSSRKVMSSSMRPRCCHVRERAQDRISRPGSRGTAYRYALGDARRRLCVEGRQGGKAGDVLHRRAEVAFVAAHQNVSAAIDQHHGVDAQAFHQEAVGVAQQLDTERRERVNRRRQIAGRQPPGESASA